MRPLRAFDEYLSEGVIKKVTPDPQRAESLKLEAGRKFASLQKNIETLGVDDENANDFVEYCYNIIMFLIKSKMYERGYAGSGKGAHEGEVSFT